MWSHDQIDIEVSEVDGIVVLVTITTPVGRLELMGGVSLRGRLLVIEGAHVQGLRPGALGRAGLNAIARRLIAEIDADGLVVEGSARTTGRTKGRVQSPFRFPHPSSP
jgi:hypothetical protein